jgi:hypothetical protein
MDDNRFDALARTFASGASRRRALAGLAGALLAAPAALGIDLDGVVARRHKKRKKHRKKRHCKPTCAATKPCGPDGCRGSCGSCQAPETCESGTCQCIPVCEGGTHCGPDGCGGTCACDAQSFCLDESCVPCDPACPAGQRCVHGTCTCDPFANQCPMESATDRCSCGGQTVDGDGATCADKFSACDIDRPCTTHDDCPVGSVCKTTCVDPGNPLGPNRCSTPCAAI